MSSDDDRWMDWDAGPVARPYTVTGGRTRPRGERYFDLVDVVARTGRPAESRTLSPEHIQILNLEGLRQTACECYATVKAQYDRLLGAR